MSLTVMKTVLAATVTIDDLKLYFKGNNWHMSGLSDSFLEAHSANYDVSITSKSFLYHVSIVANEDSSDSDEKVTDEPLEFIVQFLGEAGGNDLLKHVSTPESLAHAIRILAARVELNEIGPRKAAAELRRTIMATDAAFVRRAFDVIKRYAAREDIQKEELADLMKGLKTKGWKVSESEMKNGLPELTVDISGIYTARISIDSIAWSYKFSVRDVPGSEWEGVTNDPISDYRQFYKDPATQEAKAQRKVMQEEKDESKTVDPDKKSPRDETTVVPPRRSPEAQPAAE